MSEFSKLEQVILKRFFDRCRTAGGPKSGYLMRVQSIGYFHQDASGGEVADGLDRLVEKGFLKPNEAGDRYALTEQGAEQLTSAAFLG